jgi:tetratricopeptide (TPR) repeat protein
MFVVNIIIINLLVAGLSWWYSGFDRHLKGDGSRTDIVHRLIRCGLTLVVLECAIWCQWRWFRFHDSFAVILYLCLLPVMIVLWLGCLTEAGARLFVFLTDPVRSDPLDLDKNQRDLDRLADLVREKRTGEALALCRELEENHEISDPAGQEIRSRLGVEQKPAAEANSLLKALQLQETGRWIEAETMMQELLQARPRDIEVAFSLMRLYLRDLKKPGQARIVLDRLAQQPHISRDHIAHARNSFDEWSRRLPIKPGQPETAPAPRESIATLIKQKRYGTATEVAQQHVEEQPEDFAGHLQLAELYARYGNNFTQAKKIIYRLRTNPAFSEQQFQLALDKLDGWQKTGNAGGKS